ncbi:MAG: hypothetical protein H0T75_19680 [Rhizobiales bacterium]|nr:hypothetical protein [Hyphomicrobiales bacterium]
MRITLREPLIKKLVALPETGMGFQFVDLMLGDGRVVPNVVVLNAEVADIPDGVESVQESDIVDVRLAPYE